MNNKNSSGDTSHEVNRSTNSNNSKNSPERKHTLQGLISKIKQSDTSTFGNSIVDLSELFPDQESLSQKYIIVNNSNF